MVPHLVEVSVQQAAGQVRSSFHQLEEAHKVVAADGREGLNRKLHLRRLPDLVAELLHLPVGTGSHQNAVRNDGVRPGLIGQNGGKPEGGSDPGVSGND